MTWTGNVQITILDGAAGFVNVPSNTVQVVIGTASSGTANQIVGTRSRTTLSTSFGAGPLMQAAGLIVGAGGVVLAIRATQATAGSIRGAAAVGGAITAATSASPIAITTTSAHGLVTGDVVTVASVGGNTAANGTWIITKTGASTYTLNGSIWASGAYTSGGTTTFKGAVAGSIATTTGRTAPTFSTFAGTAVPYYTGTPNDDYYPMVYALNGFAIGTTGGIVAISLDGGRTFGPSIAVGTGTTIALADSGGFDTGLTVTLGTSTTTWATGDFVRCSTIAPATDASGRAAALAALETYAAASGASWGSIHIVGTIDGADSTTLESGGTTNLVTLATDYLFTRAITESRDASPPTAWGGSGETEATWQAAILADFSAVNASRQSNGAGYYNTVSAFATLFASVPKYRRPLAWSYAARQVTIPQQRHAGRVRDGALAQIVVNPTSDPSDGFVYHDEFLNPGLDYFTPGGTGRFTSALTRSRNVGFYISNPLSLALVGSDFALLPSGLVMDVACGIAHDTLQYYVNADLVTNANGTLTDKDAGAIKARVTNAINVGMVNVNMISAVSVDVDQTTNIQVTKTLAVTITILGVAYLLEVDVTLGFATSVPVAA